MSRVATERISPTQKEVTRWLHPGFVLVRTDRPYAPALSSMSPAPPTLVALPTEGKIVLSHRAAHG